MVNVVVLIVVAPNIAVLDGSLKRMNLYSELPVMLIQRRCLPLEATYNCSK
jgi:hypothetical protein